jgi:hypothetical protein
VSRRWQGGIGYLDVQPRREHRVKAAVGPQILRHLKQNAGRAMNLEELVSELGLPERSVMGGLAQVAKARGIQRPKPGWWLMPEKLPRCSPRPLTVDDVIADLDAVNVPLNAGRLAAGQALRHAGVGRREAFVGAAQKVRQERAATVGPLSSPDISGTVPARPLDDELFAIYGHEDGMLLVEDTQGNRAWALLPLATARGLGNLERAMTAVARIVAAKVEKRSPGKALNAAVKEAAHNVASVAQLTGISEKHVAMLVSGMDSPRRDDLVKIARAIGMSARDLDDRMYGNGGIFGFAPDNDGGSEL